MSVDRYYGMFSTIQVGSAGYIILKSSDGILLMHPDPSEIGINVISGRKQQHPDFDLSSLEKMVEKQKRGETGTEEQNL